jgi:cysteine desulfurase
MRSSETVYLDHSATTPVDPRVVEAMLPYLTEHFANSESSHAQGRAAAAALEHARETCAATLECRPAEIVFTGSGTEASNLAIRGIAWAGRQSGRGAHLVTTPIEHHAVGATVDQLRDVFGFEVTRVPVDGHGLVDPADVANAIRPDTILVSVIMANNEIGTVQQVGEIGEACHERGVVFHTDAVQAAGRLSLAVDSVGADLLSLSAHKFYGPKGVGLLYVRHRTTLVPAITGGGHERGRRPGTVNVAGAVGLATALRLAEAERARTCDRLGALRDRLIEGVLALVPRSRLTGHPESRLCHHASFAFEGVEGESIVVDLDLAGVAASSGAACAEGEPEPSFVLSALGLAPPWSLGALRLTLGRSNGPGDVDRVLDVLPPVVERLRCRE